MIAFAGRCATSVRRSPKDRAASEMRSIPIPPALAALLRVHLKAYDTTPDEWLFRTARGGALQDSAYSAVWQAARAAALTPAQPIPRWRAAPTTCATPPSRCGSTPACRRLR